MTNEGLSFMNSCLEELNIPYEFMEWTSDIPEVYWVGEFTDTPDPDEGGMFESSFILTGTTKDKYYKLMQVQELIRDYFPKYGLTAILPSGSGIAISYESSFPVPSIEENVHRLQITLNVKEWRV